MHETELTIRSVMKYIYADGQFEWLKDKINGIDIDIYKSFRPCLCCRTIHLNYKIDSIIHDIRPAIL